MSVYLLFFCLAAGYLVGAEFYRWKRGVLPFGRMGTYMWLSSAVWIVLWVVGPLKS